MAGLSATLKQTPCPGLLYFNPLPIYRHSKSPQVARSPETLTDSRVKPLTSKSTEQTGPMIYDQPIRERSQVFSDTGLQHGRMFAFTASRALSDVPGVLVFALFIGRD